MQLTATELGIGPFREELHLGGHTACPGCGSTIALRQVMRMVGRKSYYFLPASCTASYFPSTFNASGSPAIHTIFAGAFAEAEGLSQALELNGKDDERVIVWAGDGACFDIGMGGLSGIAERNANVLVICNDNGGYQNTGGHQSAATARGIITKSTQFSQPGLATARNRKDLLGILAAHRVPYLATASAAFAQDLEAKVAKAISVKGFKLIHLMTSCLNWGFDAGLTIEVARLSVETGFHPLYEIEEGRRYHLTYEPGFLPLERFTDLQRRFRGAHMDVLKRDLAERWDDLRYQFGRAWPSTERPI